MKISDSYTPYFFSNTGTSCKGKSSVNEYAGYLAQKFGCLTPGKNAAVSVTPGLLRKAMADKETGEWLERELSKAPDYIKQAQQSAIAHGATLQFVSIEFGEEYSTMITCTVTDGGGTDPDIDEWLERVKEKQEKQKAEEKKLERKQEKERVEEATSTIEFKGKDLDDLINQFNARMSGTISLISGGVFDVRG